MSRCRRSQPPVFLLPLAALVAVGCTYDWLGVEPSGPGAGTGGADPVGGAAGDAGAEMGGASGAGTGGGSAAGGTPTTGGRGGASGGAAGGGTGGVSGGAAGGLSGGGGVSGGGAGGASSGGTGGSAGGVSAGGTGGVSGGGAGGVSGGVSGGGAGGEAGGGPGENVCPGNLVHNGGFENGLNNWEFVQGGGARGVCEVTTDLVPSGAGALSIDTMDVSPPTAAHYRLVLTSAVFQVSAGGQLTLTALVGATVRDYGSPVFGLEFFDLADDPIPEPSALVELTAGSVAPLELQVTVPTGSVTAHVIFEAPNDVVVLAVDICLVP